MEEEYDQFLATLIISYNNLKEPDALGLILLIANWMKSEWYTDDKQSAENEILNLSITV